MQLKISFRFAICTIKDPINSIKGKTMYHVKISEEALPAQQKIKLD